jgi:calcineurin-like phosphoesterase family protein
MADKPKNFQDFLNSLQPKGIKLNTFNGHNEEVINNFNNISRSIADDTFLLNHILTHWADDEDLTDITESLSGVVKINQWQN